VGAAAEEEEQRGREEATIEHAFDNILIPAPSSLPPSLPSRARGGAAAFRGDEAMRGVGSEERGREEKGTGTARLVGKDARGPRGWPAVMALARPRRAHTDVYTRAPGGVSRCRSGRSAERSTALTGPRSGAWRGADVRQALVIASPVGLGVWDSWTEPRDLSKLPFLNGGWCGARPVPAKLFCSRKIPCVPGGRLALATQTRIPTRICGDSLLNFQCAICKALANSGLFCGSLWLHTIQTKSIGALFGEKRLRVPFAVVNCLSRYTSAMLDLFEYGEYLGPVWFT
jgi:hypothetical protein